MATYRLYGMVHHFGNLTRGHYIAEVADLAKEQPKESKSKKDKE